MIAGDLCDKENRVNFKYDKIIGKLQFDTIWQI